jgi:uracil phosphoribosyltransferase
MVSSVRVNGRLRCYTDCDVLSAMLSLLPEDTSVLHIGLFREKVSLQPVEYYSKAREELMNDLHCIC